MGSDGNCKMRYLKDGHERSQMRGLIQEVGKIKKRTQRCRVEGAIRTKEDRENSIGFDINRTK